MHGTRARLQSLLMATKSCSRGAGRQNHVLGGLENRRMARIDFPERVTQLLTMSDLAILFQRERRPIAAYERWLGRAARARALAILLSKADAKLAEAYAAECEAEADRLSEASGTRIAA